MTQGLALYCQSSAHVLLCYIACSVIVSVNVGSMKDSDQSSL